MESKSKFPQGVCYCNASEKPHKHEDGGISDVGGAVRPPNFSVIGQPDAQVGVRLPNQTNANQPNAHDARFPNQPNAHDARFPNQPNARDARFPNDTAAGRSPGSAMRPQGFVPAK
jgi:hypothetical protein